MNRRGVTAKVGRLEVTVVPDADGRPGGVILTGPPDALKAVAGATDEEGFLGAAGEFVHWTDATATDHHAAIQDFETLLRTSGAYPSAERERIRAAIARHRRALAGVGEE